LYRSFFSSAWKATDFTPGKANYAGSDFWSLCIGAGLAFEDGDLLAIEEWCGENSFRPLFHAPNESHYALAVGENHIQFCRAYEKMMGRKPFIGKGIDYPASPWWAYTVHRTRAKNQGRLVLGGRFTWQNEYVTVTSFKDAEDGLVACSYHKKTDEEDYKRAKIKKRFTITHDQWQAAQKELKKKADEP
jgi:hypothetical protein